MARASIRGALFFAVVHVLTISGVDAGQAVGVAFAAFVGRIPVALALGWLFARTGTIWAPLGLHATFNAILLVLAEIAVRTGCPRPEPDPWLSRRRPAGESPVRPRR